MERIWNYIYYYIYLFEVRATYFFRTILNFIFSPLTKVKFLKKNIEEKGSSFEHIDNVALELSNNPKYGKSINFANIHIGGLLVLIEISLFNLLQIALDKSLIQYVWENNLYKWIFLIGSLILPYIINSQFLWKDYKYLKYFDEFDKESKQIKRKWAWISFGIILGIFGFFILSLIIAINILGK